MRYLILAAGMARRMGEATGGAPKCLIEIAGETLIGRMIRQIRERDPLADIHVVLGYRHAEVARHVEGCGIVVNPFFDVTSIAASLWFARERFDVPLVVVHGDLVLSDELVSRLTAAQADTFIGYDSAIRRPHEINVHVVDGRLVDFGEGIATYSGLYAGVLKLSATDAARFRDALERRIGEGFNPPNAYYFFAVRALLAHAGPGIPALDFGGLRWQEIDHPADVAAARALFEQPARAPHGGATSM